MQLENFTNRTQAYKTTCRRNMEWLIKITSHVGAETLRQLVCSCSTKPADVVKHTCRLLIKHFEAADDQA